MNWRSVTIKWTSGETTTTRIRQNEFVPYVENLPMDRIDTLDFGPVE